MRRNWMAFTAVCLTALAVGQTFKMSTYMAKTPEKGELSAKQAFAKALVIFKALDKDVKGQELQMSLDATGENRRWRVVPFGGGRTHSRLSLDSKTGKLASFRDTDIEMENRRGQSKPRSVRLSNLQYEGKVRRFLELAGYRQKFTKPNIPPVNRFAEVQIQIDEIYNGLPVLDNGLGISLRASDGAFSYVGAEFKASKFAGTVKVKEADARKKAQAERDASEKPKEFKLWYARLQDSKGWRKRISEVARPYYIAKYREWDEVWIDAETGKVARHYRSP